MRTNAISLRLDDTVMERLRTRAEAERRPVRTMAALLLEDALRSESDMRRLIEAKNLTEKMTTEKRSAQKMVAVAPRF